MREALIGHTGFVGSHLARQHAFSSCYHRPTIGEIRGQSFDLVVSAGSPGVKFLANQDPETDWKMIRRLMDCLREVKTRRFVLISTLNVYADPRGVTEDDQIDPSLLLPYGRHRALLEQFVGEQFPDHLIIRLPGIFGKGLKKNVLFDLLQQDDRFLSQTHVDSIVQFYDLRRLWGDIQRAEAHRIPLLNAGTEPLRLMDIARQCFGRTFPGRTDGPVYHDDLRTRYGSLWGQSIPYLATASEVMADLQAFVRDAGEEDVSVAAG